MKSKIIAVMLAALTLIILAGCGQNSGGSPENGTIDVVKGEESYAKPIAASVPENAEIPEFYVPVSIPGVSEQVYAFVDTEGITQLRVYARQERFENGVFADAKTGFFACGLERAEDREAEGAEQYLYADGKAPTYKIVITEPAENDTPGSPVIKETSKEARDAAKTAFPAPYSAGANDQNIFCFESADGTLRYCVYGACGSGASGFWYSDENGTVTPGMPMADLDMERALWSCREAQEGDTALTAGHYLLLQQGGQQIHAMMIED